MNFLDQMKCIYDNELPRPHHLLVCGERFEELVRSMPAPAKPREWPSQLLDLHIFVGQIPADEIRFVNRRGEVYKVVKIT